MTIPMHFLSPTMPVPGAMETSYCESCGEVLLHLLVLKDPTDCQTLERCNHCSFCTPLPRARRCDICGAKPTATVDLYQVMHPRSKRLLGFCFNRLGGSAEE